MRSSAEERGRTQKLIRTNPRGSARSQRRAQVSIANGVASHATGVSHVSCPNIPTSIRRDCGSCKKKKTYLEANGKGDEHPEPRWYEHASGETIKWAQLLRDKTKPDRSGRQKEQDNPVGQSTRWPAARQSAPDVNGQKPATRRVEFEGTKDCDARGGTPPQLATMQTSI
jgi:hypothetical protein